MKRAIRDINEERFKEPNQREDVAAFWAMDECGDDRGNKEKILSNLRKLIEGGAKFDIDTAASLAKYHFTDEMDIYWASVPDADEDIDDYVR